MSHLARVARLSLLAAALSSAPLASVESAPGDPRRSLEETITVYGTRVPCIASVPFFLRDGSGRPVNEIPRDGLWAAVDWYGEEVELPILRIEEADTTIRMTFLIDLTPPFGDYYRTETLLLVKQLLNGLDLDDEVRFVRVDHELGLDDTGIVRLRDLYTDVGRWCAHSGFKDGGDCPVIETREEAEEAIQRYLGVYLRRGRGNVSLRDPMASLIDSSEGFLRHSLVVVSDFGWRCCPDDKRCLHPPGVYPHRKGESPERPPVAVSQVVAGPPQTVPADRSHAVHFLQPRKSWETAQAILDGMPVMHIAIVDAGRICNQVRKCVRIQLGRKASIPGPLRRLFSERCTYVETPEDAADRIRKIEEAQDRIDYIRWARQEYRGTTVGKYFAAAICVAMESERVSEVRVVMEEARRDLEQNLPE